MSDHDDDAAPEKPEYDDKGDVPDFDKSDASDWRDHNDTAQKTRRLIVRCKDVIARRTKGLFCYGPPGIAKTHLAMSELRADAYRRMQIWHQMAEDDPIRIRRTKRSEGIDQYRIPFVRAHGKITPIRLYARFCQMSQDDETVLCDDVRALAYNREAQAVVQDACDKQGDYKISWDTNKDEVRATLDGVTWIFPTEMPFHAGLICICNFRPERFEAPVQDRVTEIRFTWNAKDIGIYVNRMAFVNAKDGGLWKYLISPTYGPPHRQGLGFTGLDGQAIDMLRDVQKFYKEHFSEIGIISFRFLERVLADRYHHPRDWKDLALDHLTGDWDG